MKRPAHTKSRTSASGRAPCALTRRLLERVTGGGGGGQSTTQIADFNRDGLQDIGAL